MAPRIVIEEPCEHGRTGPHSWGGPPHDPDWHHFADYTNRCPGGSRRVLDLVEIDRAQGMIHYIDRTPDPRVSLWIDSSILSES